MADKVETPEQLKQKLTNITNDLQATIKTIDKYTEEQQVAERYRNELEVSKKNILVLQRRLADTKHLQNENDALLKTLRERETIINEQNKKLQQNERLIKQKDIRITELEMVVERTTLNTIDKSVLNDEKTKQRLLKESNQMQNMPVVAELSDENRPTKLAERFTELFDNQWTDAFEQMEKDLNSEENSIKVLLQILQSVMEFCKSSGMQQIQDLKKVLTCSSSPDDGRIPENITQLLKNCRKAMASESEKLLYEKYENELRSSASPTAERAKMVPKFVEACFHICWLMTIQDPPIVFGPYIQRGDAFDTNVYKAYTKNGSTVAYVVWPALLFHAYGPVLCKGVAQGLGESTRRTESAPPYEKRAQFRNDGRDWKEYSNDTHIIDSEQNGHYALNDQEYNQDLKYGIDGFDIYGTKARDRNTWDNKSSLGGTESAMREYMSGKLLDDLDHRVYDQSTRNYRSRRSGNESNPRAHYSGTNYNQSSALAYDSGLTNYNSHRTRYTSNDGYQKPNTYPQSSSSYKQITAARQPRLEYKHTSLQQHAKPTWK